MPDLRNIELKTVSKVITSETAAINLGGQVASGQKRWVTFLMIDTAARSRASDVVIHMASVSVSNPTKASIVATANRKLLIPMEGTMLSRSNKPRPLIMGEPGAENPLFSIAGGKWIGIYASLTTANIFMQYFDE